MSDGPASPARGGGFGPLAVQNRRGQSCPQANPSVTGVTTGDSSPFRGAMYLFPGKSYVQPAMLISRYMFLTEPFQEAQMPSSRSEVT